ncbi:MAG: histidinol phosphatase [Gemmatimonadetes bacterium]|nr:histidinol phosphatase [Gemmatimonadota bacterium]
MSDIARVSVHGCHSREFCGHAADLLEDILEAYADQGYKWVGVTEHMPAHVSEMILFEEAEEGQTIEDLDKRFANYAAKIAELKAQLAGRLDVIFGFETEVYEGYETQLQRLIDTYEPEYIVGSVHFVRGLSIDGPPEEHARAAETVGGYNALYCEYFDLQLELIEQFKPRVVGHFDLIRLRDPNFAERFDSQDVWACVERNLEAVRESGAILDFNIAGYRKGLSEPYPYERIARHAIEMGIPLVPGEDAHSVEDVGVNRDKGVTWLQSLGANCDWPDPRSR